MEWVWALLGFLWGSVTTCWLILYGVRRAQHKANPYRYKCRERGCHFLIAANDMELLDRFATQHERSHQGR